MFITDILIQNISKTTFYTHKQLGKKILLRQQIKRTEWLT